MGFVIVEGLAQHVARGQAHQQDRKVLRDLQIAGNMGRRDDRCDLAAVMKDKPRRAIFVAHIVRGGMAPRCSQLRDSASEGLADLAEITREVVLDQIGCCSASKKSAFYVTNIGETPSAGACSKT